VAEVRIDIEANVAEAQRNLEKLTRTADKTSKDIESGFSRANQIFNSFVGNLAANAAGAAFSALGKAAGALVGVFEDGIEAAQRQQDAINKLNTALALAGDFSDDASQSLQEYASALQEASVVGDEVILEQLALAKSFGVSNEQAKELVSAALNLSQATGISLDGAVKNLGKTLGGLTGELGESVPALRGLSKEALQSGAAIELISQRFGGAAEAATRTFSGAITQASNTFGDLTEVLGGFITSSPAVIAAVNAFNGIFKNLQTSFGANQDVAQRFIKDVLLVIIDAFAATVVAIDSTRAAFDSLFTGVVNLSLRATLGVQNLLAVIGQTTESELEATREAIRLADEDFKKAFDPGETASNILGFAAEVRGAIEQSADATDKQAESLLALNAAANEAKAGTAGLTEEQKKLQTQAITLLQQLGVETTTITERVLTQQEQLLVDSYAKRLITQEEYNLGQALLEADRLNKEKEVREKAITDEIGQLLARNDALLQINDAYVLEEITRNNERLAILEQSEDLSVQKRIEIQAKLAAAERRLNDQRLQATQTFLGGIGQAVALGGRKTFKATKAFSIAEAIIQGFLAVQRALASAPPPFNFIAAAGVGAATAANVIKIQRQQPPGFQTGLTEVPAGFPNDSFAARLTSGERVVSGPQNEDLKEFIASNSQNAGLLESINARLQSLELAVTVNVGGETIVNTINREIRQGRLLQV
jgi:hypothetical protein